MANRSRDELMLAALAKYRHLAFSAMTKEELNTIDSMINILIRKLDKAQLKRIRKQKRFKGFFR